jgi:RHS repeat-associated protein
MSFVINAFNHREWRCRGLAEYETNGFRIDPPTRSGHIESDGSRGDGRGQTEPSERRNDGRRFGNGRVIGPRREVEQVYSYTGTQWDVETSGYYYRHRIYHALLGRFVSRDPSATGDTRSLSA